LKVLNATDYLGRGERYTRGYVDCFTIYCKEFFEPEVDELRLQGKLTKGKKQIVRCNNTYEYAGELND